MAERHLTVSELADRLGVPARTIYTWNSAGGGPRFLKIGRHVRYRLSDVIKWEGEHAVDRSRDFAGAG
jgi:excisionase family DNA binding protein